MYVAMNVCRAQSESDASRKVEGVTFDRILKMADAIGVRVKVKVKVNYKQPRAKAG